MTMKKFTYCFTLLLFYSCTTTTYFITRHTEKEAATAMVKDVPLSEAGQLRAVALKELLKAKNIQHIYSTNYIRTQSTAMPLSDYLGIGIEVYDAGDTNFISRLVRKPSGNVLIIGHSNTVDNIVNELAGRMEVEADLLDNQYGDLFVIKRKGKQCIFLKEHYGL